MARHAGPVLVGTNIILESHRVGSWRALTGGYGVETVEECVGETLAGSQRREPEYRIDEVELRDTLAMVHSVGPEERAELAILTQDIVLDPGEDSLWSHARRRDDAWILCGPDRASLRCGVRLGFRERLVALERLFDDVGHRTRTPLRPAYTRSWLDRALGELMIAETLRK